jgi:hypothetical protein
MSNVDARNTLLEEEFVKTFIASDKQNRWLGGLSKNKNRRKLLGELNHPHYGLFRTNTQLLRSIYDTNNIAAGKQLYILADSSKVDMLTVDLDKLKALFDTGIICGSITLIDSRHAILVSEDAVTLLSA